MKHLILGFLLTVAVSTSANAYCAGGLSGGYNTNLGEWTYAGSYGCGYASQSAATSAAIQLARSNGFLVKVSQYIGGQGTWSGCEGAAKALMVNTKDTYYFSCTWP